MQTCGRFGKGNKGKAVKIAKKARPGEKAKGGEVSKPVETEGQVLGGEDGVQEVD